MREIRSPGNGIGNAAFLGAPKRMRALESSAKQEGAC
jgi:hypothetical protein